LVALALFVQTSAVIGSPTLTIFLAAPVDAFVTPVILVR
jgi:hypothetical protein